MERERATAARAATLAATRGILGLPRHEPPDLAQYQSAGGRVRPFAALAASSPILPGTPLGNITQVESSGFSSYHAAWVAVTKRLSRGLQFDASYTWSKSLDTNSLNSSGFAVQDGYDIPNQYGLSDFDARHRFVLSATYALPFTGHVLTRGWQLAAVVQSQSGNPVNIVTSNSSLNGMPNSVRPDVTGPIRIIGSVDRWFDPSVFVAADRFGNLGRNVVIGPGFNNTDVSLIKNARLGERASACSSGSTCSMCSTIPTSVRRATSSAARRSARSRGRDCPRVRPAPLARFSWPRDCRSEMEVRMRARVVLAARGHAVCAEPLMRAPRLRSCRPEPCLVIHSGAESFPSNPILDAGIREALASRPDVPIDYFAEYLESDLFPGDRRRWLSRITFDRKYQGRRIDLVIAMTDTGLRFVLDHRGELFPDAPIVFSGLAGPDEITRSAGGGITGMTIGVAYAETLKLALALHPSTQRVFVVAKGQDEQTLESVRAELSGFSRR